MVSLSTNVVYVKKTLVTLCTHYSQYYRSNQGCSSVHIRSRVPKKINQPIVILFQYQMSNAFLSLLLHSVVFKPFGSQVISPNSQFDLIKFLSFLDHFGSILEILSEPILRIKGTIGRFFRSIATNENVYHNVYWLCTKPCFPQYSVIVCTIVFSSQKSWWCKQFLGP